MKTPESMENVMGKALDLSGKVFSRLKVLRFTGEIDSQGLRIWECICACGNIIKIGGSYLKKGNTKSCGCLQKETAPKNAKVLHGMTHTKTYQAWRSMHKRCYLKSSPQYSNYGERGIVVCERWKSFENFLEDMGVSPEGMSIDRIDVNGNYEKVNCRWANSETQANNRRSSILISYQGDSLSISQWSRKLGIHRATLWYRYQQGWETSEIFSV